MLITITMNMHLFAGHPNEETCRSSKCHAQEIPVGIDTKFYDSTGTFIFTLLRHEVSLSK